MSKAIEGKSLLCDQKKITFHIEGAYLQKQSRFQGVTNNAN